MKEQFDFLNSINSNKTHLMREADNPVEKEKEYNAYFINKGLSQFVDTIMFSNYMNFHHETASNLMQYDFYLNTIRPKKRFKKWSKGVQHDGVVCVSKFYKCNDLVAQQYVKILSEEQLEMIRKTINETGGHENENTRGND